MSLNLLQKKMTPFRFGQAGQELFAVLHPARGVARTGALLCNPFGQEAVRLHRFYKVLADRLSRSGIATLRFDYVGTGESDGRDLDGTWSDWKLNIQQAHQELLRRTSCQQAIWVGARLGATLASAASESMRSTPPAGLVLWEPITDGTPYLRQLAQAHHDAIASPFRKRVAAPGVVPTGEALGFAMSPTLLSELSQIAPSHLVGSPIQRMALITRQNETACAAIQTQRAAIGRTTDLQQLDVPFDWTSEEAMNTAMVPMSALQMLHDTVKRMAS